MARSINLLVVHCSASKNGDSLFRGQSGKADFRTPAQTIDGWHAERGFKRRHPDANVWNPELQHIGYHFVVACNGAVFTGRSFDEVGAHAKGFNDASIGICLTGTSAYTVDQWLLLAKILRNLNTQFGVPLAPAQREKDAKAPLGYRMVGGVCGHRDLSPDGNGNGLIEPFEYLKTCPGFDVSSFLKRGLTPPPAGDPSLIEEVR